MAGDGYHRLGISQALDLKVIPVALVAIHRHCLHNGSWDRVLQESKANQGYIDHRIRT